MIIKKFLANSEEEAASAMRRDMGPEAVILTKRWIQPTGLKALFASAKVEITAGVEPKDLEQHKSRASSTGGGDRLTLSQEARTQMRRKEAGAYNAKGRATGMGQEMERLHRASKGLVETFREEDEAPKKSKKLEVRDEVVAEEPPRKEPKMPELAPDELRRLIREEMREAQKATSVGSLTQNSEDLEGSVRFLISKGVARSIALKIEEKMQRRHGSTDLSKAGPERTARLNGVKAELAALLNCSGPVRLRQGEPTVVALVGPHGVGKTTTLCKLAAQYGGHFKKRVAIVTLDTSKKGVKEQIEGYLQGYEIPIGVAADPFELQQQLGWFADRDLILIDTSGRNQYNRQSVDQLAETLSLVEGVQTYLVMSAATKDVDVLGTIQQFAPVSFEGLIFTKMDETIAYGVLVNTCFHTGKPIAYVTHGVEVPGDIRLADGDQIARSILVQHNNQEFRELRKLVNE